MSRRDPGFSDWPSAMLQVIKFFVISGTKVRGVRVVVRRSMFPPVNQRATAEAQFPFLATRFGRL